MASTSQIAGGTLLMGKFLMQEDADFTLYWRHLDTTPLKETTAIPLVSFTDEVEVEEEEEKKDESEPSLDNQINTIREEEKEQFSYAPIALVL